jgi:3-oxoacyl-[acyl-carrier-protein] synthase-1
MRRVAVTGMGIVSPIGNGTGEVVRSLREGISGIAFVPQMRELGYRCHVAGLVKALQTEGVSGITLPMRSDVARYAMVAARKAIADADLEAAQLESSRTGIVLGTGAGRLNDAALPEASLLSPGAAGQAGVSGMAALMTSTAALSIGGGLGVMGRCYAVSSACATGVDSIRHGFELIRHGILDRCIAGGADENGIRERWKFGDALNAMPVDYNDRPGQACRPFDRDRQGMVLAEGAGVLILEALEQATRRGARVYAEVIGYGSANDGNGMFEPTGRGLRRSIDEALVSATGLGPVQIDYINPHGAGTKIGDPLEAKVIREVFGDSSPSMSSMKPLNGHSQGAVGADEAIFTLLMLHHGFVAPTINLERVDRECTGVRHVRSLLQCPLRTVMTFNAGLGGANACLIFRKL